jgi:hypothetical protein
VLSTLRHEGENGGVGKQEACPDNKPHQGLTGLSEEY